MNNDYESTIFFAFRYALGRQSTAPSIVAEYIIKNKDKFGKRFKSQMIEEIEEAIKNKEAGANCDVDTWNNLKRELLIIK